MQRLIEDVRLAATLLGLFADAVAHWSLLWLVKLLATLLGLLVVPVALHYRVPARSLSDGRIIWTLPRWAFVWGNAFDGMDGDKRFEWEEHCDRKVLLGVRPLLRRLGLPLRELRATDWLARFWWLAIRNPANNLRLTRFGQAPIKGSRIRHWGHYVVEDKPGMGGWQFVVVENYGQRWSGFYLVWCWCATRALVIRLGFKVKPCHACTFEPPKGMTIRFNPIKAI